MPSKTLFLFFLYFLANEREKKELSFEWEREDFQVMSRIIDPSLE